MKIHRIKRMVVMGVLFMGICLFGDKQICQAEEILTSESQISTWQEKDAQADIEIKKNQKEIEIIADTSEVTEKYELFLLVVTNEELFSASETDEIAISYHYEGDAPLHISLEMNDVDGGKLFTEGTCSYIEATDDKYYLCQMENGQFTLLPGTSGELVIPVTQLGKSDVGPERFYGITFTCLAEQMSDCCLQLKDISTTSDNRIRQYSEMADICIKGSSQITIPYMGTSWFDYFLIGSEGTFFADELPEGCVLEENGHLILDETAQEGEVTLKAEVGNGLYVKKVIEINKPVDMGYEFKAPQDMEQVTYSLDFLANSEIITGIRVIVLLIVFITIVLFIRIKYIIRKDRKATEEEEIF